MRSQNNWKWSDPFSSFKDINFFANTQSRVWQQHLHLEEQCHTLSKSVGKRWKRRKSDRLTKHNLNIQIGSWEKTIQHFVCPTGGYPYIFLNYIYMGPPRWGTQNLKEKNEKQAEDKHMVSLIKLISFLYIRIYIMFVSIENQRKQFEQSFRLVSMFMLSFFMFYSNSHILEFISKQKEPIRTNYQWELSYVFRKDNSKFCVPHRGRPIYIL